MTRSPQPEHRARRARAGGAALAATVLALVLLLAGCGSRPAETLAPPASAEAAQPGDGLVVPAVVRQDPRRLIGLDRARITELLGPPRFVRRDGPAQMWRYVSETCVLDMFMYGEGGADGTLRARYFDVRSLTTARLTPQACIAGLLARDRQDAAS